ncbi:hypothetical protein [Streptomyces huasconensis]|uniref:hypothetical protein n=1 Tax=Streptomyces huasconensis TaxID=1854574 RepID=UPI0033E2C453
MGDVPYTAWPRIGQPPPWTPLDDHLLYTCHVVDDLTRGRLAHRPPVPSMARLAPGELSVAVGPASRSTWRAVGDGSYRHSSVLAVGQPAFVIGSLVGSALGNAARRRQAAADARQRWVADGHGEVTVTDRRAYFGHPQSSLDLGWTGLDTADLVAPDAFQCSFRDMYNGSPQLIRLHSSLMFVLAAHAAFPAHPRLAGGSWLPPGFEAKCAAYGRTCPQVR